MAEPSIPKQLAWLRPIRQSRAQIHAALTVLGTAVFAVLVGAAGVWLVHRGLR